MNTPPHTPCQGIARPPAERGGLSRRSKHSARRDAETGEPFAIQSRPHFIACHLFQPKNTTKNA